ncbi:MAG: 5-(carboxyamino)imidazole ribonucleotide mutase [Oscillospiraceae bacterium]|nr:5-(carboxyamino)imidazole ribonucleotide mutase [Oscillospiraceae bacterium]
MSKAALIMGSDSDFDALVPCIKTLKKFGIEVDVRVISAHRSPELAHEFAETAEDNGYNVIIAAAGKAAHLAGVLAAFTTLPVIGIPVKSSLMDGLDSLLSVVQMPSGIPVATVAVNGSENAAILAAQIIASTDPAVKAKLKAHKESMKAAIIEKDKAIAQKAKEIE